MLMSRLVKKWHRILVTPKVLHMQFIKSRLLSPGWKITLSGSRFLRDCEKRYAPIEGEALAIVWALEDSKYFTLGCDDLIITTDHKPLVKIFGDRALDEISNTRILKLKQRSLPWRYTIVHVPGKYIPSSDTASRNPSESTDKSSRADWLHDDMDSLADSSAGVDIEGDILAAVSSSLNKVCAVTWKRVKEATQKDVELQQIKEFIMHGFPEDSSTLPPSLMPYWKFRNSLLIVDDVILYGERIIIPTVLRGEVCKILHSAHQGPSAMIERAKSTVFWPGISTSIYKKREQCDTCWRIAPSQPHLPSATPFVPTAPFQAIAADYCQQGGHHYLITVDRFSNWPEVLQVEPGSQNAGASGLIRSLKRFFATFGVPEQLSSDGGPEFIAVETKDFLERWGVEHRLSSAYNARSNGRAECAVKSMKRLLNDNVSANGNVNTDAFTQAILQFRNTPDPQSETSPAEVLFGRPIRDTLPVKPRSQIFDNLDIRPLWRDLWYKREDALRVRLARQAENLNIKTREMSPLAVGDTCRIQNQHGQFPTKWDKTGVVVQTQDNDQYIVKVHGSNRLTLRNRKYLRKFTPYNNGSFITDNMCIQPVSPGDSESKFAATAPHTPVRSTEIIQPVNPPSALPGDASQFTNPVLNRATLRPSTKSSLPTALQEESSNVPILPETDETLQRSTRIRKKPNWQKDFIVDK